MVGRQHLVWEMHLRFLNWALHYSQMRAWVFAGGEAQEAVWDEGEKGGQRPWEEGQPFAVEKLAPLQASNQPRGLAC